MNKSRYTNIDKFVNIRYIFLLACLAYSWLFQLAQMWKSLAPGVWLMDFLTPGQSADYPMTCVPGILNECVFLGMVPENSTYDLI
jgi:hypothetical protein